MGALQRAVLPAATIVLDWLHIAMRFEHALRAAAGVGTGTADAHRGKLSRRIETLRGQLRDLSDYLEANRAALVNYGARRWRGEPISTAFVESAVNEIVSPRMIKKQQMRWYRWTVQPFLDVRTAVLNGTLAGAFRRRYPDLRPANRDIETPAAA